MYSVVHIRVRKIEFKSQPDPRGISINIPVTLSKETLENVLGIRLHGLAKTISMGN